MATRRRAQRSEMNELEANGMHVSILSLSFKEKRIYALNMCVAIQQYY